MTQLSIWVGALGIGICSYSAKALAADTPSATLLVFDLDAQGVDASLAANVTDALLGAANHLKGYRALGSKEMQAIVAYQGQRQALGCSDDACFAALAIDLKGDLLMAGSVAVSGDSYVLAVRLVEPQTTRIVGQVSATAFSPEELLANCALIPASLLGQGALGSRASSYQMELGTQAAPTKLALLELLAQGVPADLADNLTQTAALELKQIPGVSVISKDEIRALLQLEAEKQLLGCDQISCLAEIGGALGVRFLVAGSVGLVGSTYVINLKLINIVQAQTDNRVAESFVGDSAQLLRATRAAVRALVGHGQAGEGSLEVRASVTDVSWLLDGQETPTNGPRRVAIGKHNLRVEAPDYYPWLSDIYVEQGEATRVDVTLTERPNPWYRRWWVWTAVGVVVAAGTAGAVYWQTRDRSGALEINAPSPVSGARP